MIIHSKIVQTDLLGPLYLIESNQSLISLDFKVTPKFSQVRNKKKSDFLNEVEQQIKDYLSGQRREFSIATSLSGTPFQLKAWATLSSIPYGETIHYEEQARLMNHPLAIRAVGTANKMNPIPIIIPCHRVIKKNGEMGGYNGGCEIKIKLQTIERI